MIWTGSSVSAVPTGNPFLNEWSRARKLSQYLAARPSTIRARAESIRKRENGTAHQSSGVAYPRPSPVKSAPKKVAAKSFILQESAEPLSSEPVWAEPSQLLLGNWHQQFPHHVPRPR
jgi:hypothetical protein